MIANQTLSDLLTQAQATGLTIIKDNLRTYASIEDAKADLQKQIVALEKAKADKATAEATNREKV